MSELIDVRTVLATSRHARVEVGRDGVLHVLAGPVTIHLERAVCQELAETLSRAMLALPDPAQKGALLRLVRSGPAPGPQAPDERSD